MENFHGLTPKDIMDLDTYQVAQILFFNKEAEKPKTLTHKEAFLHRAINRFGLNPEEAEEKYKEFRRRQDAAKSGSDQGKAGKT